MRLLAILFLYSLFSCQQAAKSYSDQIDYEKADSISIQEDTSSIQLDSIAAKTWLTNTIVQFFDGTNSDMQKVTTASYYEFKTDAMNVGLEIEESLSEEEFIKKWGHQYDLKIHPTQVGFLISGQDWGNIKVADIRVKEINQAKGTITFSTIIRDDELK